MQSFDENSYRGTVYKIGGDPKLISGNFSRILVANFPVSVYAYYLIIRGVNWSSNDNGIRGISSVPVGGGREEMDIRNPARGDQTFQQLINITRYNVGQTIECYVFQNSGTDIYAYPYIHIILLRS